jgi:hypothetical protein
MNWLGSGLVSGCYNFRIIYIIRREERADIVRKDVAVFGLRDIIEFDIEMIDRLMPVGPDSSSQDWSSDFR